MDTKKESPQAPKAQATDSARSGKGPAGLPVTRGSGGGPPPAGSPIRVVILHEHPLFCEGLQQLLRADPAVTVVGDGDLAAIRDLILAASPDLLLVDVRVKGVPELCAELRRSGGRPWVILLTADLDDHGAVRALETGARGILTRSARAEDLLKAIHVVHEGEIWAGKRVVARLAEELATRSELSHADQTLLAQRLSEREQEIVHLAAAALSVKEIADRLAISEATVKVHLSHIFQKLGVRDRIQLVAVYHRTLQPTAPR